MLLWWALLAAAAVAGFLMLLGVQLSRGLNETAALRAEVIRSYEARAELQHILSLHQDMETGQRGFVLTGSRSFLEPYVQADRQIARSFARLERLHSSSSVLAPQLAELRRASMLKQGFARDTIDLTRRGEGARAQVQIAKGQGRALMDRIRQTIARMDRFERQQLASRTRRSEEARSSVQRRSFALGSALLLLLVIALGLLARAYLAWQNTLRRVRDLGARQEAIFEGASDGMIVLNESGSIESLNPAAARLFGYEGDELVRRDIGILFEIAPERGMVETFLRRLVARREQFPGQRQELSGRCKDGSFFPAEVSVSPVRLVDGFRFLAVLRDVTERKQVDRMKTEFVSTVSHELRTPLTSIAGSLGLIAGGAAGEMQPRALRLIEIARSNCARLIRLINDILDIEKIESGQMSFDIQPLPLARVLEQAVQANRAFAAEQGAMIHLEPPPPGARIFADEDRTMQVLTNLLSNAAKFSPTGGVVEISVTPLGSRYRISVSDHGSGISDEFRERIFSKFAQADSSDTRQKGGTGLGLSIVKEIVVRLGGSISFDSEVGKGSTFHVDLPAAPVENEEERSTPLARIDEGELPSVLHVDDDPDMLRIIAGVFEGRAEIHSTPSVSEARASILRFAFDAIILDIGMADGDGLELIPLIRQRQQGPIIIFSAQEASTDRLQGADRALVKSRDSLDRLVSEVEQLIKRDQGPKI